MEHLQHFGLTQDPFSNEPDLRFYFESASHRDVQRRVERGLRQRKGLTLLTGDGGMGKTLLARRILDGLEEEVFEATLLVMLPGAADATGILQRFARQLGTEEPATDRAGLLGQIYEQLAIVREDGRHAVLIVDDAQVMTPEVFAELGGLLSLEYEERRLLSILFVGSPELDRLVQGDPAMAQRVDVRVRLQPLDLANASAYLAHRLEAVSGDPGILPSATMETLYKFGRGRPRLLNTLADNALFEAYLAGRQAIDPGDVERAAADLGIGPDPGSTYSAFSATPSSGPAATPAAPSTGVPASQPIPALEETSSMDPVATPEFELTPAMATELEPKGESGTRDLDAGLEAALEDFGEEVAAATEMPARALGGEPPNLEPEPVLAKAASAPLEESFSLATDEPELVMGEAELTPLEAGEGETFEGVFVELIEE